MPALHRKGNPGGGDVIVMTRTTKDLIEELMSESEGTFITALVVGFEAQTKFVFSNSQEPLKELNEMIEQGGEPVGLIYCTREDNTMTFLTRPLLEFANEKGVSDYLNSTIEIVRKIIEYKGNYV
jgi:hypothetical protein